MNHNLFGLMIRTLAISLLAVLAAAPSPAATRWIRMASGDFEIFSSAGAGDTRRALDYFRRVADFFEKKNGRKIKHDELVRVILFSSPKEYQPYRPNEVAAAFYTQVAGRDYIVLGGAGVQVFPVAIHEYTHLVVRHSGLDLPPWLNEGYAEVYSTIQPFGDKVRVGDAIPGRFFALTREKWVPLATILSADRDSPFYNEKNKAGSLYSEGWALTHMLMLSAEYSPLMAKFVDQLLENKNSVEALEKVYGKPLAQIEKELQAYIRKMGDGGYRVGVFDQKLAKLVEKPDGEPAADVDVRLALLEISNRPGNGLDPDVVKELRAIAADNPTRPEPHVTLGYLQARSDKLPDALESFAKALELGTKNPQTLWDYARMASGADNPNAMKALARLLEQQPDRFEARLLLAQLQMSARLNTEAAATLAPVKTVKDIDAPKFFKVLSFAHQDTDRAAARKNAEAWKKNSKEPVDQLEAERFLRYLDEREAFEKQQAERKANPRPAAPVETAVNLTPNLGAPISLTAPAPIGNLSVTGKFVDFDCSDSKRLRFVLRIDAGETEGGRVILLMDDPQKVVMYGLNGATMDMNCGPQSKAITLRMEYTPIPSSEANLRGLLRAIHFNEDKSDAAAEPEPRKPQLKRR